MWGTILNTSAIIFGSALGILLKGGIPKKFENTIMNGLSLCVILIGISGSIKINNMILVIISMVLGGILGEFMDIDSFLESLGNRIEKKFKNSNKIAEGFITSSLLFCVGALAVVGSLESGLTGNYQTLYAKSVLDGIYAIMFSSYLGIGVMLSSISVFLYQGIITLAASLLNGILIKSIITDMTCIGSLLILGLGFNLLKITKIKVANYIPAMFIPIIYQIFLNLFT